MLINYNINSSINHFDCIKPLWLPKYINRKATKKLVVVQYIFSMAPFRFLNWVMLKIVNYKVVV